MSVVAPTAADRAAADDIGDDTYHESTHRVSRIIGGIRSERVLVIWVTVITHSAVGSNEPDRHRNQVANPCTRIQKAQYIMRFLIANLARKYGSIATVQWCNDAQYEAVEYEREERERYVDIAAVHSHTGFVIFVLA